MLLETGVWHGRTTHKHEFYLFSSSRGLSKPHQIFCAGLALVAPLPQSKASLCRETQGTYLLTSGLMGVYGIVTAVLGIVREDYGGGLDGGLTASELGLDPVKPALFFGFTWPR